MKSFTYIVPNMWYRASLVAQLVKKKKKKKKIRFNVGDTDLIPESGRSTGEGIGHPLQYFWASLVVKN